MFTRSEDVSATASLVAPTISVTIAAVASSPDPDPLSIDVPSSPSTATSGFNLDTPTITNIVLSLEGVQSGIPTRTTPTLTPTTLRNIEHLLDLPSVQPPEVHTNQAGFVPPAVQPSTANTFVDSKSWGGGIVTLASVPRNSTPDTTDSCHTVSDIDIGPSLCTSPMPALSTTTVTTTTTRRTGGRRPLKDDKLSPEEEERRQQRRERNKQAAARCRKRRLDQTNLLQGETDDLEEKRMNLQQEIQHLQQQRDELEFLLAAHKTSCKKVSVLGRATGGVIQTVSPPPLFIKSEPEDIEEPISNDEPVRPTPPAASRPTRPTSLAVVPLLRGVSELGITIETPSSALKGFGLNFESMMEGGTGLTPVTATSATGLTPLTTPVVTTAPSSNCGSQQRSSSPDSVPPKLVSL